MASPQNMVQPEHPVYLGQWPQHENPEYRYSLVNGVGLRPYNPQLDSSEPMQRQAMYPQYDMNNSQAGLPLPSSYEHTITGYQFSTPISTEGYGHHTLDNSFRTHHDPRWNLPSLSTATHDLVQDTAYPQGAGETSMREVTHTSTMVKAERVPPPSPTRAKKRRARAAQQASPKIQPSKGITTLGPVTGDRPTSNPIDALLAVVQAKPDMPVTTSIVKMVDAASSRRKRPPPVKRYPCDWDGCQSAFAHRAQLVNHIRSHTGEKPFPCGYGDCDQCFSQMGNRTTHQRGHTGEAPFECPECHRPFRSKGNIKPHLSTHLPDHLKKRWACKLDGCTVSCSSKGNLKHHQTKYHQATIDALKEKVANIKNIASAPEEDREMIIHLAEVHNNANKGIKGCGGSRIRRIYVTPRTSPETSPEFSAPSSPVASFNTPPHFAHYTPMQQQYLPVNDYNVNHAAFYNQSHRNIMPDAHIHININMGYTEDDSSSSVASPMSMASPASTASYGDEQTGRMIVARRFY